MITRLSDHFTLQEAIVSQSAARQGIDNTPDANMVVELMKTAQFMEDVRVSLHDRPIIVSSWYRCPALEATLTKSTSGHHPLGAAVDFICPGYGTPLDICLRLRRLANDLGIGQLIYEFRSWVHISRLSVPKPEINRFLTIDARGVRSGILES